MFRTFAFAVGLWATASTAHASTLDFTTLGPRVVPGASLSVPGASLFSDGGSFLVGSDFANSICAYNASAVSCANDLTITFDDLTSDISLDVGGLEPDDSITIFLYDALDALLGSYSVSSDGLLDLGVVSNVKKLVFDDSSTSAGVNYGNISFSSTTAVPLPAGLSLLLTGLGALAFLRRSRFGSPS